MKDLELDRLGSQMMRMHSEKKIVANQMVGSNSSYNKYNNTSILYNTNLSLEKAKREVSLHELSEDAGNSARGIEFKVLSPLKNRKYQPEVYEAPENENLHTYESPEPSKSFQSKHSSIKKLNGEGEMNIKEEFATETPFEEELETVKLDLSKLRSQKRGLPIEEKSGEQTETPKGSNTQRRLTSENKFDAKLDLD